jgi:protein TilB
MFTKEGKVRQCDEGGYKPILNQWDDPCFVVFKMNIPK